MKIVPIIRIMSLIILPLIIVLSVFVIATNSINNGGSNGNTPINPSLISTQPVNKITLNTTNYNTNVIIVNITNNITVYINNTNNITNNFTFYIANKTEYNNITNNITNNFITVNNFTITNTSNEVFITNNLHADNIFANYFYGLLNWSNILNNPIQVFFTDEYYATIFNNLIYMDITNQMVGINMNQGEETHAQAFTVQSLNNHVNGTLTSTGIYNSTINTTIFTSSTIIPNNLVDASSIYNSSIYKYYVFNKINNTALLIIGNITAGIILSNWSYKQAPYIDVNGGQEEERGYTISENGVWKWAVLTPNNDNSSSLCFQSSEKYFTSTEFNCQLQLNTNGDVDIGGTLNAKGFYGEIYNITSTTKTLTTQNVWYNLTNFGGGEFNGLSYDGDGIISINTSGLYLITYFISATLSANNNIEYQLIYNNSVIDKSKTLVRYTTGYYTPISLSLYYRLNANTKIYLQARNIDSGGRILSEDNRNINLLRVSN